jgi:hypothetical protein
MGPARPLLAEVLVLVLVQGGMRGARLPIEVVPMISTAKRCLVLLSLLLPLGCASANPWNGARWDTSRQLNADRALPHSSSGEVILGPSYINEVVVGQRDRAGNVHVDPGSPM